jgi:hypothetical protein
VGPRAGLDVAKNLAPTGIRSPDRPARSQSLYRLSYQAHDKTSTDLIISRHFNAKTRVCQHVKISSMTRNMEHGTYYNVLIYEAL